MSGASYLIFALGLVLEVLLVSRLLTGGLWRRYPYFFSYVVFFVVQTFVLFAILKRAPNTYAMWYWRSGMANLWMRFFVLGEVFLQAFPGRSSLRRMISGGFTIAIFIVATLVTGMLWGIDAYGKSHSIYLALERSFGFAQAVLVLLVLTVARYYQVELGRNTWGIAVAFGMYSSLATANSAFVDLLHSFFPYWRLLGPLSLVVLLAMWTWAIWAYYPNPEPAVLTERTSDFDEWSDGWGRTVSTVRKAMNP